MNKTSNNQKKELNIFLFLFLCFVILQHLGKIFLNLMNLLTPQSEYFYISKSVYFYSIVLSIAMIVVVIGTMSKKKWGVIGFFCIQIINLFGIQALSEGQADMSGAFGVTCALCAIFALLLCLRSKGESAWKIIFEQTESKPKKNYLFALRNLHWFKKGKKEMEYRNNKVKEEDSFDIPLVSEEKVKTPSDEPKTIDQHKRKPFIKVFLIVLSVIVIASIGLGSYFLYKHYTDNEYLMNKANETFKNGEIKKALAMYEELADKKDYVPAKSRLGYLYFINDSVPLDSVKGRKYLEESSVTDSTSLKYLIFIYLGDGMTCKGKNFTNKEKSKYYAEIAIRRGVLLGDSYFALGNYYADKEDFASAYYNWEKSSRYKMVSAFDNLGWMTYYGNGCEVDLNKAYRYFQKALKLNSEDDYALYHMGLFYLNGEVVKKDKLKARDYFKKAADLGNEDAKAEYSKVQWDYPLSDFSLDDP